jgi:hypothetical protein
MTAGAQALLIQAVACILVMGTVPDGGYMLNGLVVSCFLFWVTFLLLFWAHRCLVTRFDLFFLRWGSVPFVLVGTPLLAPLVASIWQSTLGRFLREVPAP